MSNDKVKSVNDMTKEELLEFIKTQQKAAEETIKTQQAEKEKLEAELKKLKVAEKNKDTQKAKQAPNSIDDWLNERVPFYAFKDNDKYKDDIVVGVNGKNFIIQRGVEVMIPRYVKMLLDESTAQDVHAANVMAGFEEQHKKRAQELGL